MLGIRGKITQNEIDMISSIIDMIWKKICMGKDPRIQIQCKKKTVKKRHFQRLPLTQNDEKSYIAFLMMCKEYRKCF